MMFRRHRSHPGFTMPEILVSSLIIAVIGAIAIPAYMSNRSTANAAVAYQDAAALATGVGQLMSNTPTWNGGSIVLGAPDGSQLIPLTVIVDGDTLTGAVRLSPGSEGFGYMGTNTWCVQVDNGDFSVSADQAGNFFEGGNCTGGGGGGGDGGGGGGGGGDPVLPFTVDYISPDFAYGSGLQEILPDTANATGAVSYELVSGSLPNGVSFDTNTGALIGPPSQDWNFQVVQVSAGGADSVDNPGGHTCVVTSVGGVKCWGANEDGQLGDETFFDRNIPGDVAGLTSGVTSVAVGGYHTCAALEAGGVECWGRDNVGQLGDEANNDPGMPFPVPVSGLEGVKVVSLAAGSNHTCAVSVEGYLYCWGYNSDGQLGTGNQTNSDRAVPVQISDGSSYTAIQVTAGRLHTCAMVLADGSNPPSGSVYCWGSNSNRQVGVSSGARFLHGDEVIIGGNSTNIANVSAGSVHTCATRTDGSVYCWGSNQDGQLGDPGFTGTQSSTPRKVQSGSGDLTGILEVSAAEASNCARDYSGSLVCWGSNEYGTLGNGGSPLTTASPVNVDGIPSGAVAVSSGANAKHFCAVMEDGALKCWGANSRGEFGNRTNNDSYIPEDVTTTGTPFGYPASLAVAATDAAETIVAYFDVNLLITPTAPTRRPATGLLTLLGSGGLNVAWAPPNVTGVSSVMDYEVQYRERTANLWVENFVTAAETEIDLSLNSGAYYDVRVRAINAQGPGTWASASIYVP